MACCAGGFTSRGDGTERPVGGAAGKGDGGRVAPPKISGILGGMMKTLLSRVLVLVLLLPMLAMGAGCDNRAKEVSAADDAYDAALDTMNGPAAAAWLSKESVARLESMLEIARKGKKAEVQALGMSDRLEVLRMRLLLKGDINKPLDGRGYYAKLVSSGWVTSTSDMKRVKVQVEPSKTRATVMYKSPYQVEGVMGYWVFEDGAWKEDQVLDRQMQDSELRTAAQEERKSENDYLLWVLGEQLEMKIPATVWDPPR